MHAKAVGKGIGLDTTRKHRLSDLNVQIRQASSDTGNETVGPEAKKARYVIAMPQSSSALSSSGAITVSTTTPTLQQHQQQKVITARSGQVQRVTVQGANAGSGSGSASASGNSATRRVYNLISKNDATGVKYMICNKSSDGKPRTVFNTTMRRGYTLADSKLRRPMALAQQQARFKQMKMQQRQVVAQAQVKLRQQQQQQKQQQQQQSPAKAKPQQQQSTSAQGKSGVPGKPLFDILKPPPAPVPTATSALDALGGSRRKHCNCSKSQCLKLYCDCFANGEFCQDCTCKDCFNNLDYEVKREHAIRSCLERNPSAFK